jgi:small conductance mechanosensitive channel
MPRHFKTPRRDLSFDRMFETRSDAWERAGLSVGESNMKAVKRAQREAVVLVPLLIGVLVVYHDRVGILGRHTANQLQTWLQAATVIALVAVGWALARDIGRAAGPTFMRRMDPATAGTVGFLIRLFTIAVAVLLALSVAGLSPQSLAVGGAFTAVVVGLAAQQTLGNLIAGMVLLSARPFRVGERIRLQAGAVGGSVEGIVSSLGLLYTTLTAGYDRVLIPNNVVLAAVVVPLKEPDSVDVKVTLNSGVRPSQVQAILDHEIATPTIHRPSVLLEELEGDELVVRVQATPELADEGAKLADEIIAALASVTGEHSIQNDQPPAHAGASPAGGRPAGARPAGGQSRPDQGDRSADAEQAQARRDGLQPDEALAARTDTGPDDLT